jgi:cytochrome oxidase Cu insertion factor (SCO1/SenC/PrrC family)
MLSAALKQAAKGKGRVYLIDPLGNIMMAYESGADPNHIRQDLKRLLTWSKLDEQ